MAGFVKAMRNEQAAFLDTNPLANHVLNVIARRARRTPDPLNKLQIGECFVGHKGLGLSEQQYRTVKKNLQKWGLVEFKKAERLTDRGTVAKLLNSDIYDINEIDPNGSLTEEQRKGNGSPTEDQRQIKNVIKKEGNNERKEPVPKEICAKAKRFTPPTYEEAGVYFESKGSVKQEANRFVDYHTSKGWIVGRVKMKDWKASARTWLSNSFGKPSTKPLPPAQNFESGSF